MAHVHELRRMARGVRAGAINTKRLAAFGGKEINSFLATKYRDDLKDAIGRVHAQIGSGFGQYQRGRQIGSDEGYGNVWVSVHNDYMMIGWTGRQIEYLEYGTGLAAVQHPYAGELPSWYNPQAEGHAGGEYWFFRGEMINGWRPYAPYYKTYLRWARGMHNDELKDKFIELAKQRQATLIPIAKGSSKKVHIKIRG